MTSTFVDLFAGIGGFHYAAREFGLKCVYACDIDEPCRAQYKHNFGITPASDIKQENAAEIPDHDILFAGFPCQPFSIIGDMKGMDDRRGTLFYDILRVLKAKKPNLVVLENVRQFATIAKGKPMSNVLTGLNQLGYVCHWKVLNALDFGLPQKRERVIIVAFRDATASLLFHWPKGCQKYKSLSDLLEGDPDHRHFVSEQIRTKRKTQHKPQETPSIWHENKAGNISSHPFSCALRANASHNYLLVNGERRLTPREQLRLQGFPENFKIIGSDARIRMQVGNAVPVSMIRAVIREVIDAESNNPRRYQETRTLSN